jgi:CDP-diacylglycerol--serine O-phosphatidyltransferase
MLKWLKLISLADLFTFANGILGFIAITYILDDEFLIGSFLIFVAMIMDGLDGAVARYLGSKHRMGRYLDSVSDTVSFCFAPAILLYATYYDKRLGLASSFTNLQNGLTMVASLLIVGLGILRLAIFSTRGYKLKNFLGIPTPATTFFVVVACLLFGKSPPFISTQPFVVLPMTIVIALLMISSIEFPKLRTNPSTICKITIFGGVVFISVLLIGFTNENVGYYTFFGITLTMFCAILGYFIVGPIYLKIKHPTHET